MKTEKQVRWELVDNSMFIFTFIPYNMSDCYLLESPRQGNSNEYPQHILLRYTDTNAYMLIYHQMPSLSASLDQIQKISEMDSISFIYLFIYLFIYSLLKTRTSENKWMYNR